MVRMFFILFRFTPIDVVSISGFFYYFLNLFQNAIKILLDSGFTVHYSLPQVQFCSTLKQHLFTTKVPIELSTKLNLSQSCSRYAFSRFGFIRLLDP